MDYVFNAKPNWLSVAKFTKDHFVSFTPVFLFEMKYKGKPD